MLADVLRVGIVGRVAIASTSYRFPERATSGNGIKVHKLAGGAKPCRSLKYDLERLVQAPWPQITKRPIGLLNFFRLNLKNYMVTVQSSWLDVLKFPLDGLERTGGVGMRIKILNGLFLCVKQRRRGGPSLLSNWERRGER